MSGQWNICKNNLLINKINVFLKWSMTWFSYSLEGSQIWTHIKGVGEKNKRGVVNYMIGFYLMGHDCQMNPKMITCNTYNIYTCEINLKWPLIPDIEFSKNNFSCQVSLEHEKFENRF